MKLPYYSTITAAILLAIGVALIVWDIILLRDGKEANTISAVLKLISQYPVFPYIFGVLAGHAFWHQTDFRTNEWWQFVVLGIIMVFLIVCPDCKYFNRLREIPMAVFFYGCCMGHWFWPQYVGGISA